MKFTTIKIIFITALSINLSISVNPETSQPKCNLWEAKHISPGESSNIVDLHNEIRQKVANQKTAQDKPGMLLPGASNMIEIIWDDILAAKAQLHANRCKIVGSLKSRRNLNKQEIGQNLFSERVTDFSPDEMKWETAISNWYKESKSFKNAATIKKYEFDASTRSFTQLVWGTTQSVGCGYSAFKEGKWLTKFYVCFYGPSGNQKSQPMYKEGKPCANCEDKFQCSKKYPGLCCAKDQCKD